MKLIKHIILTKKIKQRVNLEEKNYTNRCHFFQF